MIHTESKELPARPCDFCRDIVLLYIRFMSDGHSIYDRFNFVSRRTFASCRSCSYGDVQFDSSEHSDLIVTEKNTCFTFVSHAKAIHFMLNFRFSSYTGFYIRFHIRWTFDL